MTTATATKPRSLAAQLEKLKTARDKAREALKPTKAALDAWDREGREKGLIRREENPHRAEHDENVARFHEADRAYREFKREHAYDRLAEIDPAITAAEKEIRFAAATLADACQAYGATVESTRAVIADTPGLEREKPNETHLTYDPNVATWGEVAAGIADAEIIRPGLTPIAEWKVNRDD